MYVLIWMPSLFRNSTLSSCSHCNYKRFQSMVTPVQCYLVRAEAALQGFTKGQWWLLMKNGLSATFLIQFPSSLASVEAVVSKWPWSLGLLNSCLSKLIIGNKTWITTYLSSLGGTFPSLQRASWLLVNFWLNNPLWYEAACRSDVQGKDLN